MTNRYSVNRNESLISYLQHHNEKRNVTGATYALFFNNTGVSTVPLIKSMTGNDLTIEFMFKPLRQSGTLISYAKHKTFAITVSYTIKLHFGKYVIDTKIPTELHRWCQISIVWESKKKSMQFYSFDENKNVVRRRYSFVENPFESGGILSLGQWVLSPGDTELQTKPSFLGIIDEVRIWKRLFDPVWIQQNIGMNVLPSDPELSALWKINDGEGHIVKNLVTEEHMYLSLPPWKQPIWVFSDAPVKRQYAPSDVPLEVNFTNKEAEVKTAVHCRMLVYDTDLFSSCKRLGAELQMFYMACIQIVAESGKLDSSLDTVITFADHCQAELNLTYWPARRLCNKTPNNQGLFPDWISENCETKCLFGAADPKHRSSCNCLSGFWGETCNQVCPGGIIRPCSTHGQCNKRSGMCSCDVNWNGNENCSVCSNGWYGDRCQYVLASFVPQNPLVAVGSVFGQVFFHRFDGISFSLEQHGEFYIVSSKVDNFAVQIRQSICVVGNKYLNLCIVSLALRFKNSVIVVRAPITSAPETRNVPFVWLDSKPVIVDHETKLSKYFVMTRTSRITYSINAPNKMRFDIRVGHSISFTFSIPRQYCLNATGLQGFCSLLNQRPNTTMGEILIQRSLVSARDSLFVYKYSGFNEPRELTGGGFGLVFIDSFVVSQSLNLQDINVITVELLVNIKMYGGTLLSYASKINTFALVNNKMLIISYQGKVFDVGLSLEIGKWNQISMEFNNYLGILKIFVFDSRGSVKVRVLQLDKEIWKNDGVLALGQWIPSQKDKQPPKSNFFGRIDEVRIWNRTSYAELVKSTWRLNVQPEVYKDLLHLWKMNEVQGRIVHDLVGGVDFIMKRFHQAHWDFSNAKVTLPELEVTTSDHVLKDKATSFCYSLLLKGTLFDQCKSIGKQVAQFYYQSCLHEALTNEDLNAAINTVLSYADYCQTVLILPTWPAKELCNDFPKEQFPYWIGRLCDIKCVFGYPVISKNNTNEVECRCEYGYWGTHCENLCPGGLFNVCNGHGACNSINGTCSCEPRWSSDIESEVSSSLPCSKCSKGWTGENCDIAFINKTLSSGITIGYGDPHFTTSTGLSYHFETPGAFLLLNTPNVTVQLLQTPCNNRLSCRRISELAVRTSKFLLTVRYEDQVTIDIMLEDFKSGLTLPLQRKETWVSFTTDETSQYRWPTPNTLELVLPNKEEMVVLFYDGTLGTAIETSNVQNNTNGLGGSKMSNMITSFQSLQRTNNTHVLTQDFIDTNLTANLTIDDNDNLLRNNYSNHKFNGAGFMLGFNHGHLFNEQGEQLPVLEEFTLEFWVCIVNQGFSIQELCSTIDKPINTTRSIIQGKHALFSSTKQMSKFAVISESDGYSVAWNDQIVKTNLTAIEGIWTHFALTWRNNDGRLQIITNSRNSSFTEYGVQIGLQLDLTGSIYFGYYKGSKSDYELHGALDEIRLWQYAKTEQKIRQLTHLKFDYYARGLLLNMPLDQGFGASVNAWKYPMLNEQTTSIQDDNVTNIQFQLSVERPPSWLPSGVKTLPLTNYTVIFYNSSLKVQAHKLCYQWFYTGNVQTLCSSQLISQARFFFESCLADIADGGSLAHHKLSISLFGFYCQKVLGVEKCKLHGTYDAFPPCHKEGRDIDFPILIVTITTVVVVMVIVLGCCIICCCVRRRRKRRQDKKQKAGYLDEYEGTMYSMYAAGSGADVSLEPMLKELKEKVTSQGDANKAMNMYGGGEEEEEAETGF